MKATRYFDLSRSSDTDDREQAARELKAYLDDPEACAYLIELLGDTDWRVRRAAVESFLEKKPSHAIPQILEALYAENNAGKRNAALDILVRFGKQIVPHLKLHIGTPNRDVRMFLINILGELRDDSCLDFITAALDDEDANIASAALLSLGKIGRPASMPHLLRFLQGDNFWLVFQAIEAAGEMQDPAAISHLVRLYENELYRKAIIKALAKFHHNHSYKALTQFLTENEKIQPDVLQALLELYYSPQPQVLQLQDQKTLRNEFRQNITDQAIENLCAEFEKSNSEMKEGMIHIFGWVANERAVPLLIKAIGEFPEAAAEALIHCGPCAIEPLLEQIDQSTEEETSLILRILVDLNVDPTRIERFLQHSSAEIRFPAFEILAQSASPKAGLLLQGILDPHQAINEVCRAPLLSLCRNDAEARESVRKGLLKYIASKTPALRANAIDFFARIGGEEAFPLLFQALKDEEAIVRQKAVSLMGVYHQEFHRPLISALADEDPLVREKAATALSVYPSDESTNALMSGKKDDAIWVRIAAYKSLSVMGREEIVPFFIEQLETENPLARAVLLKALGRYRNPEAKEALMKNLDHEDPEIRKSACESLGSFNDSAVVFRLFTILENDADWSVRVAAIRALTNIRPFRVEQAFLERLRLDEDPFVRKEILDSMLKLQIDYLPPEVHEFLLDRNLADAAYTFLLSCKPRYAKQMQETAQSFPAPIRRILRSIWE